jgi:PmbA protein
MKKENLCRRILEAALGKGADCAQACIRAVLSDDVSFENDRLKSAGSEERTTIGVTVIKSGRVGFSVTTDPNDTEGVAGRALDAAEFGSPARYSMPGPSSLRPVKTRDPALLSLSKPEMIGLGRRMMERIKAYNTEILAGAELRMTDVKEELSNSTGASYSAEQTHLGVAAGGQLVRGTDILFAYHGVGLKRRAFDAEEIADRAIGYFRMAERTAAVHTGEMPVIFSPSGLSVLLLTLTLALDGKNAFLGASPLRDKLGKSVADPRFTLVDDPLLDYGPKTGAFDDEGVPRDRLALIENGVLRSFIYDLDTAGAAGARPTGHGTDRRYTNLVIGAGDTPCAEMLRGIKQGLLAHEFLGLGQGNPINGEFSLNLLLGYKIENGEIAGRVKDAMLAGNAYDALMNITAISSEREWVSGPAAEISGMFPYIRVGKLSVVAK